MSFSQEFHRVAARTIEALTSLKSDWMLIGAIPVAAWGQPRATTDADFAASLELLDAEALDREMVSRGLQKVQGPVEIPQKRLVLSKYWDPQASIGIDVLFTTGYDAGAFQKEALTRKTRVTFDGRSYPIAAPEDLILYKLWAYRQKDLDDVGTILERQFDNLDWKHVRLWSEKLGLLSLLKDVMTQFLEEQGGPKRRMPWSDAPEDPHSAKSSRVWLGTSGFSYKEWRPSFYPADVPEKKFLPFYASQLNSVEINSTFYRMPSAKTVQEWRETTKEPFRFALKAHQEITHRKRLRTPSEALDLLLQLASSLKDRLGPILFQLPPNFKCDNERLKTFLSVLPSGVRAALEFRHESWYQRETYEILRKHAVALCIHDADDHTTPMEVTAPFTYVRLRRSEYDSKRRKEWQRRMHTWAAEGLDVFGYIKHEDNPKAPLIAREFAEDLGNAG